MKATLTHVSAYAAAKAGATLQPFEFDLPEIGPRQIDIRVQHCGICHSDIGILDDDFKMAQWPLVAGHEVTGIVEHVGNAVTMHKVGDRVGLGWQSGSCGHCEWCISGQEQLCAQEEDTIVGRHGGFASMVRCTDIFAIPLPAGFEAELAAPLMCAGTTVFAPLLHQNVTAGQRTAVVGVGGLGHLAVQFLAKMGCEVTAISSSHHKDDDARKFGASAVIATSDGDELARAAGSFDFILSTASGDLPWQQLVEALRPKGILCLPGIPASPLKFNAFPLILRERRVVGGRAGSPADTRTMIDFAAKHGVRPMIEKFPLADINTAVDRVRQGKARFRAVVDF